MKIKAIPTVNEIEITDIGVIKKAHIEFKKGLNIITGKNASGKSTVINYLKENSNGVDVALLMDDVLVDLDENNLIGSLKLLSECNSQVILTLPEPLQGCISNIDANIINTASFEVKE